jgi:hypothetical protein
VKTGIPKEASPIFRRDEAREKSRFGGFFI